MSSAALRIPIYCTYAALLTAAWFTHQKPTGCKNSPMKRSEVIFPKYWLRIWLVHTRATKSHSTIICPQSTLSPYLFNSFDFVETTSNKVERHFDSTLSNSVLSWRGLDIIPSGLNCKKKWEERSLPFPSLSSSLPSLSFSFAPMRQSGPPKNQLEGLGSAVSSLSCDPATDYYYLCRL